MKKILAVILSIGMLFSITACGGNKNTDKAAVESNTESESEVSLKNITKEEYEQMTADDLLKTIKDPENVTLDEYVAIVETLKFVDITENLELKKNITEEALKKMKSNPKVSEYVPILIKNEAPQVRGRAHANAYPVYSSNPEFLAEVKEMLKTEKDPYVLYYALYTLSTRVATDPEIGEFVQEMTNNENEKVRQYAIKLINEANTAN